MKDNIIEINEEKVKDHLGNFVRETVEETLNAMLKAIHAQESLEEARRKKDQIAEKLSHMKLRQGIKTGSLRYD